MINYISGANGFIGKALAARLENVVPIKRNTIPTFRQPFTIWHLGAYGNHYSQRNIEETLITNINWTAALMLAASKSPNCQAFYNFSTSSVTLPTQTLYSATKLVTEQLAKAYGFTNIRPYSVYGPGEAAHRFIPTVIRHLQTGEMLNVDYEARHDWIYIDDFITALIGGKTEIGSGKQYTNAFIVGTLQSISGKSFPSKPCQLRNYDTDEWICSKPVQCRTIREGLKQTYEYFTRENNRD